MREDMFKIIVERPRGGRSWARPYKLKHDKDLGRKHAGLKRSVLEQHGHTKHLNENLAPLRRYLHKQKGRNWDAVFSEICARLDTGSTVKMHVRLHIEDFVMLKISITENGVWLGVHNKWRQPSTPDEWWMDLYVDPNDNIIKETSALRKKLGLTRKQYVWASPDKPCPELLRRQNKLQGFVKIKNCWFSYRLSQNPKLSDRALHDEVETGAWRTHLKWAVTTQKQLSKKQLKQFGLVNGLPKTTKTGGGNEYG